MRILKGKCADHTFHTVLIAKEWCIWLNIAYEGDGNFRETGPGPVSSLAD